MTTARNDSFLLFFDLYISLTNSKKQLEEVRTRKVLRVAVGVVVVVVFVGGVVEVLAVVVVGVRVLGVVVVFD